MTTIPTYLEPGDYFSAACGLYWYCVDWHSGQDSDLYALQCELDYHPGMNESGPEEDSADAMVYADLESGNIDPRELFEWIQADLARARRAEEEAA